jgi:hypothetical protein
MEGDKERIACSLRTYFYLSLKGYLLKSYMLDEDIPLFPSRFLNPKHTPIVHSITDYWMALKKMPIQITAMCSFHS